MDLTIERAKEINKEMVTEDQLIIHSLNVQYAMGAMAKHFGADPEHWEAVGYLHDTALSCGFIRKNNKVCCGKILLDTAIRDISVNYLHGITDAELFNKLKIAFLIASKALR